MTPRQPSIRILGTGWVTPLGSDLQEVTQAILDKKTGEIVPMIPSMGDSVFLTMGVKESDLGASTKEPRLRRSSLISHCAVTAALACIKNAGFTKADLEKKRVSIFYATSDGGVIYTRKFYDGVYRQGASGASPLLFPETVHNAPTSHIAALLGLSGHALSFIGDSACGFDAMLAAQRALAAGYCDLALVIGAEEADPISCYGYAAWGIAATVEKNKNRAFFSSGAGAVLLGTENGKGAIHAHPGKFFARKKNAVRTLGKVLDSFTEETVPEALLTSNAGTRLGKAEELFLRKKFPETPVYSIKNSLGESLAAGSLWQVIFGNQLILRNTAKRLLLTAVGYNGQVAALHLEG